MGDNFSPELNARMILDDTSKQLVPKDQLVWDFSRDRWVRYWATSPDLDSALSAGAGTAGFDNVACFFRLAGFDAVVPGREDFRFGPERLRELARYLASDAPGGTPVQMLGTNLVINTISVKPLRAARANVVTARNYSLAGLNGSSFRLPACSAAVVASLRYHERTTAGCRAAVQLRMAVRRTPGIRVRSRPVRGSRADGDLRGEHNPELFAACRVPTLSRTGIASTRPGLLRLCIEQSTRPLR